MASHTVYAGDTWIFDTTLTDSAGDPITSLDDAWFSVYSSSDTEIFSYELIDSEVTLVSNVLTLVVPPSVTALVLDGAYYLDVKVQVTGGSTNIVTYRDRLRVIGSSPLADDY